MPSNRRRSVSTVVAAGVAAAGVPLLLAGCFLIPSSTPVPTATPPTSGASTPSGSPSTPATEPTATPTATSGCPGTTVTMPAGATKRATIDVDGDGKPDTEWLSDTPSLRFGVTTASGATYSYALSTASPAAREGFVARLNDHRILSLVDDNRTAYLHFFVNCAWVQPKNAQGADYTFDFNDFRGNGTGVGCSLGYVYGYEASQAAGGSTYTVKGTKILLNNDGSRATNGVTTTLVSGTAANDPKVKLAQMISCGTATVATAGVTLEE